MLRSLWLVPLVALNYGGWAAITVRDLPDYVVAGQPVTLTFTVRQHGVRLLSGLSASVDARSGDDQVTTVAAPGRGEGQYAATLTLPRPGEWSILPLPCRPEIAFHVGVGQGLWDSAGARVFHL